MLRKLIPILLALLGVGAGVGAGIALKAPAPEVVEILPCGPDENGNHTANDGENSQSGDENTEF